MSELITTKESLENFVTQHWNEIDQYLLKLQLETPVPFYSSVDIRESKSKFAPVDHNMYPAGFNNICQADLKNAQQVILNAFRKIKSNAKLIAIHPESHTKNLMYLDHLAILSNTIREAGYDVQLISFDEQLFSDGAKSIELVSHSGQSLTLRSARIMNDNIMVDNQEIDIMVMNHDQSNPLNVEWKKVKTPVVPTPLIGWFRRQKNTHFSYYKKVVDDFCHHFSIDSDLLQAKFVAIEDVDFEAKTGLEKLGNAVDSLIAQLPQGSKVFAKASQGTYGMGISVVSSGEEIINMNRKTRNKMDVGKNAIKFTSVLVQEGVETILKYDDMPAEITIYLIDGMAIGGFMRANSERDSLSNLNSKGMVFRKLCICDMKQGEDHRCKEAIYAIIARLSTIAAGLEIKEVI